MKTESKLWQFVERYIVAFALFDILGVVLLALWMPRMESVAAWMGNHTPWVTDNLVASTVGAVGLSLLTMLFLMWLTGSKERRRV